jgi:methyl-accepting chemotaxis protein
MKEISVKIKMWGLIGIMLLFIIVVGAVAFLSLDRGAAAITKLVDEDGAFLSLCDRVHLNIIQLRRYEKDYFLNIGNPAREQEYLKKFQEIDAAVPQMMANLAELAQADEHLAKDVKAKAASLAGLYAEYREGFYDTVRRINAAPGLSPQQANILMVQYKANIPVLEEDIATLSEAGDQMMRQISKRAVERGQEVRFFIMMVIVSAMVLAGLLGAALCRSIYRAIFREGLRRMSHHI